MRLYLPLLVLIAFATCGPPDDPWQNPSPGTLGGTQALGGRTVSTGGILPQMSGGNALGGGTLGPFGGGSLTGGVIANTGGRPSAGGAGGILTILPGKGGTAYDAAILTPSDNPSCMRDVAQNGYVCRQASCAACKDNETSLELKCQNMVNCLQVSWPCTSNCWQECLNKAGGSGVLDRCVKTLQTLACSELGCGSPNSDPADASVSVPDSPTSSEPSDAGDTPVPPGNGMEFDAG